jgi:hypothetical protein
LEVAPNVFFCCSCCSVSFHFSKHQLLKLRVKSRHSFKMVKVRVKVWDMVKTQKEKKTVSMTGIGHSSLLDGSSAHCCP